MRYRIYALIHGETLTEGKIFECEIKKMSFGEQAKRKFAPIQSVFSQSEDVDYYKTYVTSLRYVDPIKIKSEYVIACDIQEEKPDAALGGAIKAIDRIARFLSLASLEDVKRKFGRDRGSFEPYIYQVNKIYLVDNDCKESDVDYRLESGHMYLPNRPEQTQWRDVNTRKFLNEIFYFDNEILERALKYLYRSSIGHFVLDSHEKIALDHFKSIEIIVNSLSNKHEFKDRLIVAANKIGITPDEQKRIKDFWDSRSKYGDIAHPSKFDQVERYPNQFPIPSNALYPGGGFDSIAPNIILKYYQYIKGVYIIDINEPSDISGSSSQEGKFNQVFTIFPFGVSDQNHLVFYTSEKDKNKLKRLLKKSFSKRYKIPQKSIIEVVLEPKNKSHINQKKFKLRICTTI